MTETADYMIAKMIELSKGISIAELYRDIAMYAIIIFGIITVVGLILMLTKEREWQAWMFLIGLTVTGICGFLYARSMWDLYFMHEQMEGLKTAYVALYGPIPPGLI